MLIYACHLISIKLCIQIMWYHFDIIYLIWLDFLMTGKADNCLVREKFLCIEQFLEISKDKDTFSIEMYLT